MSTRKQLDHFYYQAKKDNFLARSVFKLQEIQKKHKIIKAQHKVLDLGCSPGSWLQYVSGIVKTEPTSSVPRLFGIDMAPLEADLSNKVCFLQKNIMEVSTADIVTFLKQQKLQVVLSDMAPKTTGILLKDQTDSVMLCEKALEIALVSLEKEGTFLCKIFQGPDVESFVKKCRTFFKQVGYEKPSASRKESKEIFILCRGFKNEGTPYEV